jgi:hypothetical protein
MGLLAFFMFCEFAPKSSTNIRISDDTLPRRRLELIFRSLGFKPPSSDGDWLQPVSALARPMVVVAATPMTSAATPKKGFRLGVNIAYFRCFVLLQSPFVSYFLDSHDQPVSSPLLSVLYY